MHRLVVAAALACAATAAHALPTSFDGEWTVDVRTTVGECPAEGVATIVVQEGKIVGIDAQDVAPWGYIESSGDLSARFTRGQEMMRANGKLKGKTGSGAWSSNTNYCGGKWTARRAG